MSKRTAKQPAVEIFRVEQEIENASGPTGEWKVTDTFGTLAEAKSTVAWLKSHGGNARVVQSGTRTAAQLDAEIAEALAMSDRALNFEIETIRRRVRSRAGRS